MIHADGNSVEFKVVDCSGALLLQELRHRNYQSQNISKHALRCALEGVGAGAGVELLAVGALADDVVPVRRHAQ